LDEFPKYVEKYANIIESPPCIPNRVLSIACKYSLFTIADDCAAAASDPDSITQKNNIIESKNYKEYWLYYASRSPIWQERILEHGGVIDELTCKITFQYESREDQFYEKYGYEPDEQSVDIQQKCLGVSSNILTSFAK
jgi:hypothetical protein